MDEFEENREKGNLTAELLNREKVKSTFYKVVSFWGADFHIIKTYFYRLIHLH